MPWTFVFKIKTGNKCFFCFSCDADNYCSFNKWPCSFFFGNEDITFISAEPDNVTICWSCCLGLCFSCPWLSERFSVVVPIYNGVIFLFVLANFCMATFMDPGIFPRGECINGCVCVQRSCSGLCK